MCYFYGEIFALAIQLLQAGRRLEWGLGRAAATICHALKEVKQNAIYNVTSFFSSVSDLAII